MDKVLLHCTDDLASKNRIDVEVLFSVPKLQDKFGLFMLSFHVAFFVVPAVCRQPQLFLFYSEENTRLQYMDCHNHIYSAISSSDLPGHLFFYNC